MMNVRYIFTCDICGDTKGSDIDVHPENWVTMSKSDRFSDAKFTPVDFTDKHICDECCLTIRHLHD